MLRVRGAALLFLVLACTSPRDPTSTAHNAAVRDDVVREQDGDGVSIGTETEIGDSDDPVREDDTHSYDDFEKDLAEYLAADNLYTTALLNPEAAPRRFRADRLKRKDPNAFRDLRFSKVRGFVYWNDSGPQATFNEPGCAFGALTQEGVPCPSAQVPGVVLDARAANELARVIHAEPVPDEQKVCMCGGKAGPRHSYVFYDEADVPIASVVLNLGYHDLLTYPDTGRWQFGRSWTSPGFQAWYAEFCRSAGMPLCFHWDSDARHRFSAAINAANRSATRDRDHLPLEHVEDRPLSDLDARSRRVLCAYSHRNTFRVPTPSKEHFGLTSPLGEVWLGRTLPWKECEAQFPRCPRTLSEVWPCQQAALAGDPGFFAEEVRHCRSLASCVWGIETGPQAHTVLFQHLAQSPGSPSSEGNQGPQFYWLGSSESLARAGLSLPPADPGSPETVDFSRHDVLVFTYGDVGSGGYSIRLYRIDVDRGLSFDLASERPARNQPTPAVMRHPLHMVRVNKGFQRGLPLRFFLDGKETAFTVHVDR